MIQPHACDNTPPYLPTNSAPHRWYHTTTPLNTNSATPLRQPLNNHVGRDYVQAISRLREALTKDDIGLPLLVLIAQQLGCTVFDADNKVSARPLCFVIRFIL